jgi:hypothetical protein
MQTSLQFGNPSTFQEWSAFKKEMVNGKRVEKLSVRAEGAEGLILHLSKQLQGGGIIKEVIEDIPLFPETLRQAG